MTETVTISLERYENMKHELDKLVKLVEQKEIFTSRRVKFMSESYQDLGDKLLSGKFYSMDDVLDFMNEQTKKLNEIEEPLGKRWIEPSELADCG